MDTPENLDLVNIHFQFDILSIFDYQSLLLWLNNIAQEKVAMAFHYPKCIEQYKIMRRNLQRVIDTYFFWDYKQFTDPIDQYIYICKNWEKLNTEITKDLDLISIKIKKSNNKYESFPPHDLILTEAYIFVSLNNLSKKLLELGLKHQFKRSNKPEEKYLEDKL